MTYEFSLTNLHIDMQLTDNHKSEMICRQFKICEYFWVIHYIKHRWYKKGNIYMYNIKLKYETLFFFNLFSVQITRCVLLNVFTYANI